ncbi:universal stress protein [Saccharopolyspora sp. K220]|uniref:universal stress protein n=1 Tax=Saccharopolyspora soli TaxID=2926618 RepID=UPI001F5A55CA|nr:universal stress protein [Saccharopolyspora soli]MCI2423213.1 universal stress protein [Saccharopolyspora soli]
MPEPTRLVVVGVDGSERSALAASWAADDAHRRLLRLHLVLVNDDPARSEWATTTVHELATRCRAAARISVTEEVASGHPVEVLVRRSTDAGAIVVGSRGLGGFAGALLGSVSTAVAMRSSCPVVVVRESSGVGGPVVVGLDTSPLSHVVLEFALDAAAVRGLDLVVMQLWPHPEHDDVFATPIPLPSPAELQQVMQRRLAEQVAGYGEKYPDVNIKKVAQYGHPVAALADASRSAELIVVGHRGRAGYSGALLGSVAAGVLHHAHCPVAVVRTDHGEER